MFYVDSKGACIQGNMFCVGSGAAHAYAVLDTVMSMEDETEQLNQYTAEEVSQSLNQHQEVGTTGDDKDQKVSGFAALPLNKAIEVAVKAVRHATYRDGFSGGYINVLVINATGTHHVKRIDSKTIKI